MVKLGKKAGGRGVSSKFTSWKRNKPAKAAVANNNNNNNSSGDNVDDVVAAAAATPDLTQEEIVEQRVDNEALDTNADDDDNADDDANAAEDEREPPEPLTELTQLKPLKPPTPLTPPKPQQPNESNEYTQDKENELDAALSSSLLQKPPSSTATKATIAIVSMSKSRSSRSNHSSKSHVSHKSANSRTASSSSRILRSIETVQERREGIEADTNLSSPLSVASSNVAHSKREETEVDTTDLPSGLSIDSSVAHSTSMNSHVTSTTSPTSPSSSSNPFKTPIVHTIPSSGDNPNPPSDAKVSGPTNSPHGKLHSYTVPLLQRLKERETAQLKKFKKKVRILTGFGNALNVTWSETNHETAEDGSGTIGGYNLRGCHPMTACGDVEDLVSGAVGRGGGGETSFSELDGMRSTMESQRKGNDSKNEDIDDDGDGDGLVETCDKKIFNQEEKESFLTMWYAAADYICLPTTTTMATTMGEITTMVDNLCSDIGPEKVDDGSKSIAANVEGATDRQTAQNDSNPAAAATAATAATAAAAATTATATATAATTTLLKESPLAHNPKFARIATFPPTSTDQQTLARAFVISQRQAFRPPETDKARMRACEEESNKATRASASKKANKVEEDAEVKISAYHEEMKLMEANLEQESKKNENLSAQVAELKQGIVIALAKLKKDVYVARSEAQHALDERNATIAEMECAIATLNANIEEERKSKSKWMEDASVARTEAQRAVDERDSKIATMERAIGELESKIEAERTARDEAMQTAQINAQVAMEARNEEIKNMKAIIASLRSNVDIEKKIRGDVEKAVADRNKEMEVSSAKQKTVLKNLEANLRAGEIENLELHFKVEKLKGEILASQMKQQTVNEVNACLAEEAAAEKEAADRKIKEQTKALNEMESNWKRESKRNANLNAQISKLKGRINDARTKQEELDEVARRTKEEAEKRIQKHNSCLSKYSLEDDIIDEDNESMVDDQDTYMDDTEASQSYTISNSESSAEKLGSVMTAETDDGYASTSLPPTPREMTPRESARGDDSVKLSKHVAPASSTGADLQRTEEEPAGVMSWFGFGNKKANNKADHIVRNSDMLFQ